MSMLLSLRNAMPMLLSLLHAMSMLLTFLNAMSMLMSFLSAISVLTTLVYLRQYEEAKEVEKEVLRCRSGGIILLV